MRTIPSHPMEHFPWDSNENPITMDKPENFAKFSKRVKKIFLNVIVQFLR